MRCSGARSAREGRMLRQMLVPGRGPGSDGDPVKQQHHEECVQHQSPLPLWAHIRCTFSFSFCLFSFSFKCVNIRGGSQNTATTFPHSYRRQASCPRTSFEDVSSASAPPSSEPTDNRDESLPHSLSTVSQLQYTDIRHFLSPSHLNGGHVQGDWNRGLPDGERKQSRLDHGQRIGGGLPLQPQPIERRLVGCIVEYLCR